MSRPKRIGFVRIAQETNALSPVLSEVADFERTHWVDGDELVRRCTSRWKAEAPGFIRNAELSGFCRAARDVAGKRVELVPIFSAWAVPGGKLSAAAFAELRERLVAALQEAGPLDGLFFSMHGAMIAENHTEPEAVFLRDAREVLGPEVPVAAGLDLHALLTPDKVEHATILQAYRTNPHRDHFKTGYRAGKQLTRTVLGQVEPTTAWRSLPMVLGGGTTIDFFPTMRPVFKRMNEIEKDPRVLNVSLLMCHLWLDHPENGWATHVTTDGDPALAAAYAEELAEMAWERRHKLPPELPGAMEAVQKARAARIHRRLGTVCISDASDMVGAGATGENTQLLRVLLDEAKGLRTLAPIRDAEAAAHLHDHPVGAEVDVVLGGKILDPEVSPPLPVTARIRSHHDHEAWGKTVVIDVEHMQLVVTTEAPLAMKPSFYSELGLSPMAADICVVKSLFPFRLYFLFHNRKTIYAKTQGCTDFDAGLRIEYARPVHPQTHLECWRPADADRRRVPAAVNGPSAGA